MVRRFLTLVTFGHLAAVLASAPAAAIEPTALAHRLTPAAECDKLVGRSVALAEGEHFTVTAAERVEATKPYCRVSGRVPGAIQIEVRLPLEGWSERFLETGCGGLCGHLRIEADDAEGCAPVEDGTVILASTDMGHETARPGDNRWGNDPGKRIDFAYRGVHVTALAAKALARIFYGRPPRWSYFSGCSDGGREALMEAERYPLDFDGIAAGAPALNFHVQNSFYHAWQAASNTGPDGRAILTAIDLPVLHRLAVGQCDGIDGLRDGQIDDPRLCHPDLVPARCPGAPEPGRCLTDLQIAAARNLYDGAHDAQGRKLVIGGPQPGSELAWEGVFVARAPGDPIFSRLIAEESLGGLMFTPNPLPSTALAGLRYDLAYLGRLEPVRALYDADNADLRAFFEHGGRLILYHGWSDPHISPLNTLEYHARVGRTLGTDARDRSVRLFLLPAMYHCGGGDGPSAFALLRSLFAWVEDGRAPDMMVARRVPGQAAAPPGVPGARMAPSPPAAQFEPRTRPIFAYPAVARYSGAGSIDDWKSFVRFVPPPSPETYDWAGHRP